MLTKLLPLLLLWVALALGASVSPRKDAAAVEQLRRECVDGDTTAACLQFELLNVVEQALTKDSFQVSEDVSVVRNSEEQDKVGRAADGGGGGALERYARTHDLLVRLPWDSTLRMSARNLDRDQLDLSLRLSGRSESGLAEEGRRSRLKKIIVPILVFVLLKAITLIPLFIGVLGLKAWNALQLSFFSFVISVALAIFQLCRKIASDAAQQPQIAAHGGWDSFAAARSSGPDAHLMAYSGYAP